MRQRADCQTPPRGKRSTAFTGIWCCWRNTTWVYLCWKNTSAERSDAAATEGGKLNKKNVLKYSSDCFLWRCFTPQNRLLKTQQRCEMVTEEPENIDQLRSGVRETFHRSDAAAVYRFLATVLETVVCFTLCFKLFNFFHNFMTHLSWIISVWMDQDLGWIQFWFWGFQFLPWWR